MRIGIHINVDLNDEGERKKSEGKLQDFEPRERGQLELLTKMEKIGRIFFFLNGRSWWKRDQRFLFEYFIHLFIHYAFIYCYMISTVLDSWGRSLKGKMTEISLEVFIQMREDNK